MYERIGRDPRHHNLSVLLEEYIPERNFPDWSMGYQRIAAGTLDNLEGFPTFAGADPFLRYFQATPQKSMILLQTIGKTPHP